MSDHEKYLEELIYACRKVIVRQQKEIEALRELIDSFHVSDNPFDNIKGE